MKPESQAPTPVLWQPSPTKAGPQHWLPQIESVSFTAESNHYRPHDAFNFPVAYRSPFRSGTIHLSAEALTITGVETKPIRRLERLFVPVLLGVVLLGQADKLLALFVAKNALQATNRITGCVALLLAATLLLILTINERRRGSGQCEVCWQDVKAVQVDPKQRWLCLVYAVPAADNEPGSIHVLTLSGLEPSVVATFADTLARFAPNANCALTPPWKGMPRCKTFLVGSLVIGGVFLGVFLAWYAKSHKAKLGVPHTPAVQRQQLSVR